MSSYAVDLDEETVAADRREENSRRRSLFYAIACTVLIGLMLLATVAIIFL